MNYLLALFLPPLSVLFAGRFFTAVIMAVLWLITLVLTYGVGHIVFVVVAWVIIASAKNDRRHRELLRKSG